jgi:hypothetical protein
VRIEEALRAMAKEAEKDYDPVLVMRYAYAKWLVKFSEEQGISLGVGELAEVEAAEFRVRGLDMASRSDVPAVESNVSLGKGVLPWEPEVLGAVAHELIPVFVGPPDERDDGE